MAHLRQRTQRILDRVGVNAGPVRLEFPDQPPGLKRYILCSHQVSDRTMARIGRAISRLGPPK